MCGRCNKPYFGGLRRCEQNMEEEREFNPADLVRLTASVIHLSRGARCAVANEQGSDL